MTVITRFAPSPTGFLHIGGARTALFNFLYAKKMGGKMLLRIEDTDRARSTEPAIAAILDGLNWLGLHHDGEEIYQFARAPRHAEVAHQLLAEGKAYNCYCSPEELTLMRENAMKEGKPPRYNGMWRDNNNPPPEGVKPVVRLKAPQIGTTPVYDQVQGTVEFDNKELDDLILLRSDGTPTYMLAVVVDDHDMNVTHIIRGNDHFVNAARQSQIYQAMGWHIPVMSHIPLIHGSDGAKLSKRHGALGVEAYREMGYLPSALRNYLVRLGWASGDKEFFTDGEMVELFNLEGIGRSPARFDFAKLENMNGQYIRTADNNDLMQAIETLLPHHGDKDIAAKFTPKVKAQVLQAMTGLKERAKTLNELIDGAAFIYTPRPLPFEEKAKALITDEAKGHIKVLISLLDALPEWSVLACETCVKGYVESIGAKLGQVAQPLRASLTGRTMSPGIYDVLFVLGKDEALARLKEASL